MPTTPPPPDGRPDVIVDVDVRDGLFSLLLRVACLLPGTRQWPETIRDEARAPVASFRFVEGWVVKYEGPTLTASGNDVAIETLEIAHEGLELE